jgi:hypothetical protein
MSVEERIKQLELEKKQIKWILRQYRERRLNNHHSRLKHVKAMGLPIPESPKPVDLYTITSDKMTGLDYLFWNYPNLWIEMMFKIA